MPLSITWFPRSWIQIETAKRIIAIDPAYLKTCFQNTPSRIEFSSWPDPIDGLPQELESADLILVTHHHKDHCKRVTVDRLRRPDTLVVAPPRCARELGEVMTPIQVGERLELDDVAIEAVPAYNTEQGRSTRKQHPRGRGVGYLVTTEGRTIYHAGDTDLIPEILSLGPVDVALLPIGGTFTMDIDEAVEAALPIGPRAVIPIHRFGADPHAFARAVETRSDIQALPLAIGQVYHLPGRMRSGQKAV